MRIVRRLDQLDIDPDPLAVFLDAPLEDMGDTQLAGDLRQVVGRAFVMLGGGARDHFQVSDLGQAGQDFILDAIGEISVSLFRAQVFKGQDGDRLSRSRRDRTR